ncbi:mitochondrial respiratory chain complex I protein [Malassezia pachydermatis]
MFATKVARYIPTAVRANATQFLRTKRTTNLAGLEIHPDPLPELVSTYTQTLKVLQALPASAVFRQSSEAVTQQRLDIVRAAMTDVSRQNAHASEAAIDKVVAEIDGGVIEEILDQAHDEFHLATKMIDWKPYVFAC